MDSVKQYAKEAAKYPLLSADEEKQLFTQYRNGDENAKQKLVQSNLKLVMKIARSYATSDFPYLDVVQEGNLGLMKAVDKFDHTKGFRFSTYAVWWIKQAIVRAIADKGKIIRTPVHVKEKIEKIKKFKNSLAIKMGRDISDEELADNLQAPVEVIKHLFLCDQDILSINSPIKEDTDTVLAEVLPDDSPEDMDDNLYREQLSGDIVNVLSVLDSRTKKVIMLRYGFADGVPHTLEEIGQILGVTRERIRQIETKGLKILRAPVNSNALKPFLDF